MRARSLLPCLLLAACGSELAPQPAELPLDEVYRIAFVGSQVEVVVEQSDLLTVDTETRWRGNKSKPEIFHQVDAGVLLIDSACPESFSLCEVTHHLGVPDDVTVEVDIDRGNVAIRDVARLNLDQNFGDVHIEGLRGSAIIDLFEANLTASNLRTESFELQTSGGADLSFEETGSLVQIDAQKSAVLRVPEGAYRLDLAAQVGQVSAEDVFHVDDAETTLDVKVAAGQVIVRGR